MLRMTRKSLSDLTLQTRLNFLGATLLVSICQPVLAADAAAPVAVPVAAAVANTTTPAPAHTTTTTPASLPAAGATVPAANPAAVPTPTPVAKPATSAAAVKPAAADDATIAQVIWVKGEVKAQQGTEPPRILARRSPVYEHDILTTGGSSTGEVAFTDSSVLTLRESTEIRLDEYKFAKDGSHPEGDKSVMSLVKGGFRTITGAIPKKNPDGYAVNTPVATIGVRGTDYAAYYTRQEGLMAKIFTGKISVKNDQGMVELSKEMSKIYALIKVGEKPVVTAKEPPQFSNQPPVTPVTPGTVNSIGTPAGSGGGSGGGSKTVSSFCVGLLKSFTQPINDFFS